MDFDLTPYFESFDLTPKQIGKIACLLKSRLNWWGIDNTDLTLEVAIIAAPDQLSELNPEAIELLRRCQGRVWAFKNRPDDRLGISQRTFGQLFNQLLRLGLIAEGDTRQKLWGSKDVSQLKTLLQERGLPTTGNKNVLVERLIESLGREELNRLVADVTLFRATEAGLEALRVINELSFTVGGALWKAIADNSAQINAQMPPVPKKLPANLAEVYTEEEWEEIRALPNHPQEATPSLLSLPLVRYTHPEGPGLPLHDWHRVDRNHMTAGERRAVYVNALVAITNLAQPGFVILSDRSDTDRYVQFTESHFEAAGGYWQEQRVLSTEQKYALFEAGLQESDDMQNLWTTYGERSLEEMATLIEKCFAVLGSSPDFGVHIEFEDGALS